MKPILTGVVAYFALWFASSASFAAPNGDLKVVYSNLNADGPRYDELRGWAINGPDTGGRQFLAMPFVPEEDTTVKKFLMALVWVRGPNVVNVSLRTDAGGIPGDVIDKTEISDLPPWKTCCKVTVWRTKGIPVVAGVKYWLVALTTDVTMLGWQLNTVLDEGVTAFKNDVGARGWETYVQTRTAYSVLGE
jgi:hypothetical protein